MAMLASPAAVVEEGAPSGAPAGVLRVLAWPGPAARLQNPYTWLLYSHLERLGARIREFTPGRALSGGYDVLHAHWPDKALNAGSWLGSAGRGAIALAILTIARRRGAAVVWTAHNAEPHESRHPKLEQRFWSQFVRRVDAVIHLSHAGRYAVEARYPSVTSVPHIVVPHGHFRDAYPNAVGRDEARAAFGIPDSARVITFIGRVREYKNVPHLVRTVRALPSDAGDLVLLVAGGAETPELADEIRAAAGDDPRVRLALRHVPEADVQHYLRAADLVVLPFREITNSGSAVLALSFDRPVLVPALGAMGELQAVVGRDWVHTYQGELTPGALRSALQRALVLPPTSTPSLGALEWPAIARQTMELYANVLRHVSAVRQ
jgi:glycosyltransferase involved in cell wall biosynthesis